jgi:hypothetical protein
MVKDPNRDYQKSKVYNWEDQLFASWNVSKYGELSFEEAQAWIDFIWFNEGRTAPPRLSIKDRITVAGTGERLNIICGHNYLSHWVLTHEIAHALIDTQYEGKENYVRHGHGPKFVATYAKLLEKYLKFDHYMLYKSLRDANIDFESW